MSEPSPENEPTVRTVEPDWAEIRENKRLFDERVRRRAAGLVAYTTAAHPGDVKRWFEEAYPDSEVIYTLVIHPEQGVPAQEWLVENEDQAAYLRLWHG